MPAASSAALASCALATAPDAANVRVQLDACEWRQQHQRHEHVHRPSRPDAAAAACAADCPIAGVAAARASSTRWILASAT